MNTFFSIGLALLTGVGVLLLLWLTALIFTWLLTLVSTLQVNIRELLKLTYSFVACVIVWAFLVLVVLSNRG